MVKIGIVSLAHMHAFSYGAALQKIPGAQLVGIFDPDQKRGAEGAKRFSSSSSRRRKPSWTRWMR